MKLAIFLLGAGGTGKTTTRKSLCKGEPEAYRIGTENTGNNNDRYFYTIYSNCALAGNPNSGSDANTGPAFIRSAFNDSLERSDIVIVDGVMASPRWVEMVNDHQEPLKVLLVHFNLSETEIIRRLMGRRKANGKVEEALPEKTLKNALSFKQRAINAVKAFEKDCVSPVTKIEITDSETTEQIVSKIEKEVNRCSSMAIFQS